MPLATAPLNKSKQLLSKEAIRVIAIDDALVNTRSSERSQQSGDRTRRVATRAVALTRCTLSAVRHVKALDRDSVRWHINASCIALSLNRLVLLLHYDRDQSRGKQSCQLPIRLTDDALDASLLLLRLAAVRQ